MIGGQQYSIHQTPLLHPPQVEYVDPNVPIMTGVKPADCFTEETVSRRVGDLHVFPFALI